jgi:uncharacterized protein DUF3667
MMHGTREDGQWSCPGCGAVVATPFCPGCGEARPRARDLTLVGFLLEAFHTLTDVDGRFVRSFRALLTRPGELTLAYASGHRKDYLGPLQLFLIANVLFFALQALTRDNIFSTTLDDHLNLQDWKVLAGTLVTQRLRVLATDLESYAPRFDAAAVRNAKSLVVLMTLPFTLLLPLFFRHRARSFVVRAVFALHLYGFLLLVFCLALLLAAGELLLGGNGLRSSHVDLALSLLILGLCTAYLYGALGRVWPEKRLRTALKACALSLLVGAIMLGYRFLVFVITLYTTS